MHNFEKAHILGGPGTGKSYLAEEISERLEIPHIDLDAVCWNEDFTARTSHEVRLARLQQIAAKPTWVVEGAYCSQWVTPTLEASDVIVSLEMPTALQKVRLLRRLGVRALHGKTTLHQAQDLLQWVDGFEESRRELSPQYEPKIIVLSGKSSVRSFLSQLGSTDMS